MEHAMPDARDFGPGFLTAAPAETLALGRRAAERLAGGEVLLLWGPLGAGKTLFIKGLCGGLAVEEDVVSPTFTIANRYTGRLVVHHLDFYRLDTTDDLHDIGLDAVMDEVEDGGAVLLAEWPAPLLPWLSARLEFLVVPGDEPDERVWRLRGMPGLPPRWDGFLGGEAG
ncbi:tRNA (adenosine(37)-N6)-threonylcarbamoyltransferase complex ATPase subunit type 1 TsaE [bacterium]|nr:tRNA (adenosine(37)-N6)-threonylcarbamoyltransferase complex ATPase subunit type 1 TsaE [bacterium]